MIMNRVSASLLSIVAALLVSGCQSVHSRNVSEPASDRSFFTAFRRFFSGRSQVSTPTPSEPLPVSRTPFAPESPDVGYGGQRAPQGEPGFGGAPRYALTRQENLNAKPDDFAASRVTQPAQYRVLYFPGEQGDSWSTEGSREVVRVKDEQMASNPFASQYSGGANFVESSRSQVPTAREYVAPDRNAATAASRISAPRRDGANTYAAEGLFRTAEYRRAKIQTSAGEISGWVRPLGVVLADEKSTEAAKMALDRSAGEQLVYFPADFGWGGFVADERGPYTR